MLCACASVRQCRRIHKYTPNIRTKKVMPWWQMAKTWPEFEWKNHKIEMMHVHIRIRVLCFAFCALFSFPIAIELDRAGKLNLILYI